MSSTHPTKLKQYGIRGADIFVQGMEVAIVLADTREVASYNRASGTVLWTESEPTTGAIITGTVETATPGDSSAAHITLGGFWEWSYGESETVTYNDPAVELDHTGDDGVVPPQGPRIGFPFETDTPAQVRENDGELVVYVPRLGAGGQKTQYSTWPPNGVVSHVRCEPPARKRGIVYPSTAPGFEIARELFARVTDGHHRLPRPPSDDGLRDPSTDTGSDTDTDTDRDPGVYR